MFIAKLIVFDDKIIIKITNLLVKWYHREVFIFGIVYTNKII